MRPSPLRCGLALAVLASAVLALAAAPGADKADKTFGKPHIDAVTTPAKALENAKVINFGKVIYQGKVDVNTTLERVRAGKKLDHRNDGAIFRNREKALPAQRDRDYYREFVHQVKGLPFPGPQRVIVGKKGEVYYTGDHYSSFTRVR
jgi:filamentous hemagglutinin